MKYFLIGGGGMIVIAGSAGFFLLRLPPKAISIVVEQDALVALLPDGHPIFPPPEATSSLGKETSSGTVAEAKPSSEDIDIQLPLPNPPGIIRAMYATAWTSGSPKQRKYFLDLIGSTELNAIVVDVKDYSGFISYRTGIPEVAASGAEEEIRIVRPNALLKEFHDQGVYVIARISVFQDPILARAHPEWALKNAADGTVWEDRKGLAWMDPAVREVWDYNLAIAEDALRRGFDEVNFDYIRFPSDGALDAAAYPRWDEITPRREVMKEFFVYVRNSLPNAKVSADLFGLVTVASDDLGIGQYLEDAAPYFDYLSPMVYPSHYADGVFGYEKPVNHPYEVVKESVATAVARLATFLVASVPTSTASSSISETRAVPKLVAKIRPWLQDFDLGAEYGAQEVRAQINGSDEAGGTGWMLWDPSNIYTKGALLE